ncbi:unnamed protein product [Polarella glacialis]|uniref:Uncharacterized protein n=1 Tax=Polarella glacialis TaxID=89957 RepID=A0A813E6Y6_POLGL|nr:unnamed protein product [Polarella glacialis]
MWGLRLINGNYQPFGDGRDYYFTQHPEYMNGRAHAYRAPLSHEGRDCQPRTHTMCPKPPSARRTELLYTGKWECSGEFASCELPRQQRAETTHQHEAAPVDLWECSGEFASASKSSKSLPRCRSSPAALHVDPDERNPMRPRHYMTSMQTWLDSRQSDLRKTPSCLRAWQKQGDPRPSLPPLY